MLICSSPQLIAACRVLLRLLMPRHSPYALFRLNFFSDIKPFGLCLWFSCLELLEFLLNKYLFGLLRLIILWKGFPLRCTLNLLPPGSSRILGNCIYPNLERLNLFVFTRNNFKFVLFICSFYSSIYFIRFSMNISRSFELHTYITVCKSGPKWTRTTDLALIRRAL